MRYPPSHILLAAVVGAASCTLPSVRVVDGPRSATSAEQRSAADGGTPDARPDDPPDSQGAAGSGGDVVPLGHNTGAGGDKSSSGRAGQPARAGMDGTGGAPATPTSVLKPLSWTAPAQLDTSSADVRTVALARNRDGELAIAWLQEDGGGYFWLRRYLRGAWDPRPFALTDAITMVAPNLPIDLSLERGGGAQALFVGKQQKTRWLRWAGEPSVSLDQAPLVLGDQTFGVPLALAGDDQGTTTALWSAIPSQGKVGAYTNTRRAQSWGTPTLVDSFSAETGINTYFLKQATSSNGWFVGGFRNSAPTDNGPQPSELRTYTGQGGSVSVLEPLKLTLPLVAHDWQIDRSGNATALFALRAEATADRSQLYWSRHSANERAWTEPARLGSVETNCFALTTLTSGEPIAAWVSAPDAAMQGRLYVSHHGDAGWSEPVQVGEPFFAEPGADIALAGNSAGNLVIVWGVRKNADGASGKALHYTRNLPSLGWSQPAVLTDYDNTTAVTAVTVNENGSVLVIWRSIEVGTTIKHIYWSAAQ